ncbi:GFA family protein [Parahaliea aestuarii]|uniref:GFA family protein n=1 Tax=Parahaliea aestuarii TaxID=1852021 RepID=A0A5C9A2N0_9GAMM|nr:GFA family protein [Parahaliea aestuarii]TXS93591.1 GFA family protein [Parahaliea aestuarii]
MTTVNTLSGSCLCGTVRYTATGEPERFYHCHCSRCRKATGTGHASNLFLQGSLQWNSGEASLKRYTLPEAERFSNTFCGECGSRMPLAIEAAGMVFIPAGSLDEDPAFMPQARIFQGSRASWSCDASDITCFEEYPS